MTDHPRLSPSDRLDDAHRHDHGGRLVDLAFGIVDHWTLQRPRGSGLVPYPRMFVAGVPIALVFLLMTVLACLQTQIAREFPLSASAELMPFVRARSDLPPDEDIGASSRRPPAVYVFAPYTP